MVSMPGCEQPTTSTIPSGVLMASDRRPSHREIWAVVPVKETVLAKQRLADVLSPRVRQHLAVAMFEDVMQALAAAPGLNGIAVFTLDAKAAEIASRWGAEVWTDGARDGRTGAVTAAARRLGRTRAGAAGPAP